MNTPDTLTERVEHIRARIAEACRRSARSPHEVTLVAVAKGHSPDAVARMIDLGVRDIGESYVQEFQARLEALTHEARRDVRWHFIGHLQRNKVRHLAAGPPLHCLHSLDSVRLAETLERRLADANRTLDVLIEVNLADEASKAGVGAEAARRVLEAADAAEHLRARGLMCIPPDVDSPQQARPWFAQLRKLRDTLDAGRGPDQRLAHLSMGMSQDFEIAIEEGATLVRVGTALFGPRP